MRAFSSASAFRILCVLACCAWVCGSADLSAQPVAASQEATTWSVQPQLSGAAGPLTLRESVARLGKVASDRAGASMAGGRSTGNKVQMIVFGAVLGGLVVTTVLADSANAGLDFPEGFVPVVGPFIALLRYDDVVTNPNYEGGDTDKALYAASGIAQTVCAVMFIRALVVGGRSGPAPSLTHVPNISVSPIGRRGFVLNYQKRF